MLEEAYISYWLLDLYNFTFTVNISYSLMNVVSLVESGETVCSKS